MSRVLVTGGSGFIGSHVIDALLGAGHAVRNFDLRPSPYHRPGEVHTVLGDLTDDGALYEALDGCDAVLHLAAHADVGLIVEDPAGAEEANSRGTLAVLEACRRAGVKRVVYGSTIWVYGESTDDPVTEESGLGLPKHIYTASKLAGEMYCTSYAELYGLEPTILRFGIPYGPRARPATVIAAFTRKALGGEPLTLAGDGMQTRRFVYVEDLADGVVRALDPRAAGRVYNLAGTETVTIKQVAETVRDQVADTGIVHTPGRNGDFAGAEISSVRAREELGWTASTSLDEGVAGYLAWLRDSEAPAPAPARAAEPVREGIGGLAVAALCALLGTDHRLLDRGGLRDRRGAASRRRPDQPRRIAAGDHALPRAHAHRPRPRRRGSDRARLRPDPRDPGLAPRARVDGAPSERGAAERDRRRHRDVELHRRAPPARRLRRGGDGARARNLIRRPAPWRRPRASAR